MKRLLLAALALLALGGQPARAADPTPGSPPPASVGDLGAIKQRGTLRIGADPSAGEPYYWQVGARSLGFEAELARALGHRLGIKVTFVSTPWREIMPALSAGRIDLGLNALEIRQDPAIRFSRPYYVASQAILVRMGEQRIYGLSDLAGRRVATTDGSVASAILAKLRPNVQVRLFADTQAPFKDLASGKADAVLLESAMVRVHAKADAKKFRLAGLPLLPRPYGIAMRQANPLLANAVEKSLLVLQATGETPRILKQFNLWDSLQAGAPPASVVVKPSPAPALTHLRRRLRRRRLHHGLLPHKVPLSLPNG